MSFPPNEIVSLCVSLLRCILSIPAPLFKRGGGILSRVSCIVVADGAKIHSGSPLIRRDRLQGVDSEPVEPLVRLVLQSVRVYRRVA